MKARRVFLAVGLVVIAGAAVAAVIAKRHFTDERLAAMASDAFQRSFAGKLEVARVHLSFPPQLVAEGVAVRAPDGGEVLRARAARAELRFRPLLSRRIEISTISADQVFVEPSRLRAAFAPLGPEGAKAIVSIDAIELRDVSIAELRGITAHLTGVQLAKGSASFAGGSMTIADPRIAANVALKPGTLIPLRANASGRARVNDPRGRADVTFAADVIADRVRVDSVRGDFAMLAPMKASGVLELSGEAPLGELAKAALSGTIRVPSVQLDALPVPATDVVLPVQIRDGFVRVNGGRARIGDGQIELDGRARVLTADGRVVASPKITGDARITQLPLALLGVSRLRGTIAGKATLSGTTLHAEMTVPDLGIGIIDGAHADVTASGDLREMKIAAFTIRPKQGGLIRGTGVVRAAAKTFEIEASGVEVPKDLLARLAPGLPEQIRSKLPELHMPEVPGIDALAKKIPGLEKLPEILSKSKSKSKSAPQATGDTLQVSIHGRGTFDQPRFSITLENVLGVPVTVPIGSS